MSATRRSITYSRKETPLSATPKKNSNSPLRRFLTTYSIRHAQAILLTLGQITRAPFTTILIFLVMGIALAFPTGLFVALKNVQILSQSWNGHSPIVLYLKLPAVDAESLALVKQIEARPEIKKVEYISPQQGLADFQKQSGFSDLINILKKNPLPASLIVTPKEDYQSPAATETLLNSLKALPQVDLAKLDLNWVQRLDALLKLAEKLTYGLSLLLGLGVILITSSTIHLALQNHREEIAVYQLLGATDRFIRRPFLYRGTLYGLLGGIVAWLIVSILLAYLATPTETLSQLYGSTFSLEGLGAKNGFGLLLLSMLLGWVGAAVAVFRHRTRV